MTEQTMNDSSAPPRPDGTGMGTVLVRFLRNLLVFLALAWGNLGLESADPKDQARARYARMADNLEHGLPADFGVTSGPRAPHLRILFWSTGVEVDPEGKPGGAFLRGNGHVRRGPLGVRQAARETQAGGPNREEGGCALPTGIRYQRADEAPYEAP